MEVCGFMVQYLPEENDKTILQSHPVGCRTLRNLSFLPGEWRWTHEQINRQNDNVFTGIHINTARKNSPILFLQVDAQVHLLLQLSLIMWVSPLSGPLHSFYSPVSLSWGSLLNCTHIPIQTKTGYRTLSQRRSLEIRV